MANFIALVFATLKSEGVDTTGMSIDEAIKKYREITDGDSSSTGKKGLSSDAQKTETRKASAFNNSLTNSPAFDTSNVNSIVSTAEKAKKLSEILNDEQFQLQVKEIFTKDFREYIRLWSKDDPELAEAFKNTDTALRHWEMFRGNNLLSKFKGY